MNQFDKHVEILEEQYIDKEIDARGMLQRKVPTAQTVKMYQVQSIDTVDNITVNKQRQVPRTGPAQWQDPGGVSCEATHVPMIQKMQKRTKFRTSTRRLRFPRRSSLVPEIARRHDPTIQKAEDAQHRP